MYRVIRSGELQPSPGGTIRFEGESYGSGFRASSSTTSLARDRICTGIPTLKHGSSAPEKREITADGKDIEAGPGDIVVVSAETPHKFKNIGNDRLDIICIHASPRMIQEELEE